jgi:uncharacterized DUF497 family protein
MPTPLEILSACTGFEWDEANADKDWIQHQVSPGECEEAFFNHPLLALPDVTHSKREPRFLALGQTDAGRPLFVAFTVRRQLVRVISARDMSRRERKEYDRAQTEEDSSI